MRSPIASQKDSRYHVRTSNDTIIDRQTKTPRIGTTGTNGVRYGRGASGLVLRITMIPMHTITKATRVPILVMFSRLEIGRKPEKSDTKTMKIRLQRYGVRHLG